MIYLLRMTLQKNWKLIGYNNIESKKLSIKDKSYVYQKIPNKLL